MEVPTKTIEKFLSKQAVVDIENRIAENLGCKIYKEDLSIILKLVQKDIIQSNLEYDEIQSTMLTESDNIIGFATRFLSQEEVEMLGLGTSILYTIYWIYLSSKSEEELLDLIIRRRIPLAKEVVKQLQKAYNDST